MWCCAAIHNYGRLSLQEKGEKRRKDTYKLVWGHLNLSNLLRQFLSVHTETEHFIHALPLSSNLCGHCFCSVILLYILSFCTGMKQTIHFRCLFLCNLFNITANWTELAFTGGFSRQSLIQCHYLNLLTSTMSIVAHTVCATQPWFHICINQLL